MNSGTHVHNHHAYNVYRYGELEFFFVGKEEKKFWDLLKTYKDPALISSTILLKGIFFRKGTRDSYPNYVNSHIHAYRVSK